ncbi:Uncharacterized conserved protein [Clostridium carnis]|uniref:Uncharacterized conserved protein n=1 Tax=Clostridium carnis TaxID=1530 RepID=A0ABY6SY24_9CLOT|nr:DUF262 domain-containing protein [Clostridium carnis]VDG73502.1 Uncharacterized conserved protein [Clostridium carnis]
MSINKDIELVENEEELLENEEELSTSFENKGVYPMSGIKVEKGFYTVFELKRKYDSEERRIILDSDFQRDAVWKLSQKAELIESILMGLPLPIFYFNEDKSGRLIVIDGRQRLTALFEFLDNNFSLGKLKILTEFQNKKFKDLSPLYKSKIEDYQIQAHVIQPPTPDRIKFDIFDRVNRAGTQLNKQEIRNALYQGKATELLKRISKSKEFSLATGKAFEKNNRMKDKYLILRFISFYLYFNNKIRDDDDELYQYKNDLDDFLGISMETLNDMTLSEIRGIEEVVLRALKNSYYYLGENAFRLISSGRKKTPINMNVFEIVLYIMKDIPCNTEEIKDEVYEHIHRLLNNAEFIDSIKDHRDNLKKINIRFMLANNIIRRILNDD